MACEDAELLQGVQRRASRPPRSARSRRAGFAQDRDRLHLAAVPTNVVRPVDQKRGTIVRIARRVMQSGGLDQQVFLDLFIEPPPVVGSP